MAVVPSILSKPVALILCITSLINSDKSTGQLVHKISCPASEKEGLVYLSTKNVFICRTVYYI